MKLSGIESLPSPSLLFSEDTILSNLDRMIEIVEGNVSRLRPHIKTHKCAEILALQLERGITRIKCATIAEAHLAASAGVPDILLSYPAVGPTASQLARLALAYPETRFSTLIDSIEGFHGLEELGAIDLSVYLDLDIGMSRTGIRPGEEAISLIQKTLESSHLEWAGIHAYDGHIRISDLEKRSKAHSESMALLDEFLNEVEGEGILVPFIVSGGSPTFALHARKALDSGRAWECSPGTTFLWDAGYSELCPELDFQPAAFLLTRVVSHPGNDKICLDLGHKAVSAENPIENRVLFPDLPSHKFVGQSEEHLVLGIRGDERPPVGTVTVGIPYHVCPSVALYDEAHILKGSSLTDRTWKIAARNRKLAME